MLFLWAKIILFYTFSQSVNIVRLNKPLDTLIVRDALCCPLVLHSYKRDTTRISLCIHTPKSLKDTGKHKQT